MTEVQKTRRTGVPRPRPEAATEPAEPAPPGGSGSVRTGRGRRAAALALAGLVGVGAGLAGSELLGGQEPPSRSGGTTASEPLSPDQASAARWQAQADHFYGLWGQRLYHQAQDGNPAMSACLAGVRSQPAVQQADEPARGVVPR